MSCLDKLQEPSGELGGKIGLDSEAIGICS